MKLIFDNFLYKTNNIDKLLISLVFFFPLLLVLSIFLADLFASLLSLIVIGLFFSKENRKIFLEIKYETYFFLVFYFLILISLIFSTSFKESFLPSFFYFRYFLFIMGIYYLLKKYTFFKNIIFYSLTFVFIILIIDSFIQLNTDSNLFGYARKGDPTPYLTSFFNDEKKLGSYIVRLLPLLISLMYYLNYRRLNYLYFALSGVIIFYSSERVALFLFIIFSIFYFLIIKKKIQFISFGFILILSLFTFNKEFKYKYFDYTLMQLGLIETQWNKDYNNNIRYYSKEHEDFVYTAFRIFQKYKLTGSGVKTFYIACKNLKKESDTQFYQTEMTKNKRDNILKCSTHPHSTYFQILSDTGILTFIFVFMFFLFIVKKIINILSKKNTNNMDLCFYFLNVGILLNLFPFIPSGNFFNNWLSLILFYPFGLWLYINHKIKIND